MSQNKVICVVVTAVIVGIICYYEILYLSTLAILAVCAAFSIYSLFTIPLVPKLEETWWGPGDFKQEAIFKQEFKIEVSDNVLEDLKIRLFNTRHFAPPINNVGQEYGINTILLAEFIEYWKTNYNWKTREIFLNKYPHYKINIQGLKIHYVHIRPTKSADKKIIPLLLLHGWPGSFREFYECIPFFTAAQTDRTYVFELIIPSLPGYGFSDGTLKPGLGPAHIAIIMKNLMKSIGFDRFYIQGGDWGAVIVQHLAVLFPENVIGIHSNMPLTSTLRSKILYTIGIFIPKLIVQDEYRHWMYPRKYGYEETGYMHLQATKPDTIGVSLNDSPAGLAAYILEKIITWTKIENNKREDGGLKENWSYERLLDNIMIYWVNGNITNSMRIYAEYFTREKVRLPMDELPIKVPSGVARYSNDIIYMTDFMLKDKFANLVHSSNLEGSHFAAFHNPELFTQDVCEFISKVENLHTKNLTYDGEPEI